MREEAFPGSGEGRSQQVLDGGACDLHGALQEGIGNDGLTTSDLVLVCKSGTITEPPECDIRTQEWKYRVEGWIPDGGRMAAVFTFRDKDAAVFITAFRRT